MSIADVFLVNKLIKLIKANRCLYDPRSENHSNRAFVNSVWKSIAVDLGQPETFCREKWINLRSNFARELRKTRRKMYEEGVKASSQWVFYEEMMFLSPFVKTRLATVENITEHDDLRMKMERESTSVELEPIVDEQPELNNSHVDGKRKHVDEDMDDDKMFLLSLHSKLKELPLLDNLAFRIEVHTLLLEKLKSAMKQSTVSVGSEPFKQDPDCV
ncbi:uncharacterized protein LOC106667023 [Cimex lectularius]|uniref:Transcription factor Adf-1 n=1 Tax=Cimex lectularius TaxID=79782 RepID=A0A8I6THS4_CIMLE|nr:uncharacterized protein LOC106667023 [Cimex lectularius]